MQDKIFAICETLAQQGIKPTLENVRKELGGGSFSTINPLLKLWKEIQATRPKQSITIPAEAAKAAEQATALIWTIATEHHAETITAIKSECDRIEQAALAERDEALAEITALEEKIKQLEATVASLSSANSQKDSVIVQLEREAEKQQIKHENSLKNAEKAEARINQLEQQNAAYNENLNVLKLELAKQQLNSENNATAMQAQQQEINALKKQLTEAEKKNQAQAKELNSLNLHIQKLQTALDSSAQATAEAKAERAAALNAEKPAIEKAAALAGQLQLVLDESRKVNKTPEKATAEEPPATPTKKPRTTKAANPTQKAL